MEKEGKEKIINRPPVVVILGHVDHGKSSILEKIKDLKITAKESGGITQHIGAYEIEHQGKKITFIDTPGHEAFTAMRSRGTKTADIAVLVIAGEEGIKPQTKEAIKHIRESKIPVIVTINKIDKPQADPEKIKRELMGQEVLVESMGGKIPCIETSAQTGKGIPELLELILLMAEMENLTSDISKNPEGMIIESHLDPKRGTTATLIIKNGVLRKGEILGTKSAKGKIRIIEDFQGNFIEESFPSSPTVVIGFETVPKTGEQFRAYPDMESAQKEMETSEKRIVKLLDKEDAKFLNIIIKTDVLGSIEAIEKVLKDIPQEKAVINVVKAEVGEIKDSDVKLAKTSNSKIIGFRVKANKTAEKLASREKISIITFQVIYELGQMVKNALQKKVAKETVRNNLGKIKVLAVFKTDKKNQIIGGKVAEGLAKRGTLLEVYRNEELTGKGKIIKLQQDKKDVEEAAKGRECGILYQGDIIIEEGDILQLYVEETVKGEL